MYNVDTFVNSNAHNVNYQNAALAEPADADSLALYDKYSEQFEKRITYDKVNSVADPVLVYELRGEAVAWYDLEMFCGYIA